MSQINTKEVNSQTSQAETHASLMITEIDRFTSKCNTETLINDKLYKLLFAELNNVDITNYQTWDLHKIIQWI